MPVRSCSQACAEVTLSGRSFFNFSLDTVSAFLAKELWVRFLLRAEQTEHHHEWPEMSSPRSPLGEGYGGPGEIREGQNNERKIKLMKTRLKIFTTILSVLACCAFLPTMQAQLPPEIPGNPDGCYPAFTTAEGCNALHQLFGGVGNTGVGWYSNFLAGDASFNTGVGAGTLALTSRTGVGTEGNSNTAVGTAAMILNLSGSNNTAVGTNALVNNMIADRNNAVGAFALNNNDSSGNGDAQFNNAVGALALFGNVDGLENEAFGDQALLSNVSGSHNVAIGDNALLFSDGSSNVAVGDEAGTGVTTGSNIIAIGAGVSGVDSDLGELDDSCYIGNIAGQPISAANFVGAVGVDSDGKLGTFLMDAHGNKTPVSSVIGTQKQAMSNGKIEELQATVARQQKQIDALTAGLQKVSAQLEVSKPAPQVVTNKP
jgi:hypothetical protein